MKGAVEAANKSIKKILQQNWQKRIGIGTRSFDLPWLPTRLQFRSSTGATPFSLVYGMEAMLPVEVKIPSLWVLMETELEEAEWIKA